MLPHVFSVISATEETPQRHVTVHPQWLICQNTKCRQVIVQIARHETLASGGVIETDTWIAVPKRRVPVTVDASVPLAMRQDYIEAWNILDDSWRMSSVLSRRILGDLLRKFDGSNFRSLNKQIEAFIGAPQHPSRLKENLQYLREMGDFAAHTQEDQDPATGTEPQIIDVSKEEAEWTLKVVADLFDYFITGPEKDKKQRAAFDEKIKKAGRKPLT
jgi:hypothetical protein